MNSLRDILLEATELTAAIQERCAKQGVVNLGKFGATESASDYATVADIESEIALREFFAKHMGDYNFFGEEKGGTYNGNGKVIYADPIDGTKNYVEGKPAFGTIIGVYENGVNIGGVVSNTRKGITYVATEEHGFERIGDDDSLQNDAMYIGIGSMGKDVREQIVKAVKQEFPDTPIATCSDILHKVRVYDGRAAAYFHPSLATHDIAANPIFGKITGVLTSDHRGTPYTTIDPVHEEQLYKDGSKNAIYSKPILIARNDCAERLLRVLSSFANTL